MNWKNILWVAVVIAMFAFTGCDSDDDLWGNWVELGAFEGIPRSDAVSFVIGEYAYVGTGYDGEEDERLRDFWRYDPANDFWVQVASLPLEAKARNGAVAFSANGKGYVGTGYDGKYKLKDFWEYNPLDGPMGSWTQIEDFPGTARYSAVAFGIQNKGFVGTGYDDNRLKDFWQYDPATAQWTQIVSIGGSKRRDAVAWVMGDVAYVATGQDNFTFVTDVWKYDALNNTWTELRKITSNTNDDESYDDDYNIVCDNAVVFVQDGKAYLTTGGKGYAGKLTWEYDPVLDFWDEKTSFEGASRSKAVAFTINNVGYVTTGHSSSYYMDDVWIFFPDEEEDEND